MRRVDRRAAGGGARVVDELDGATKVGGGGAVGEALVSIERRVNVGGGRHEHVDEEGEERWRGLAEEVRVVPAARVPVDAPLVEYAEDEVSKDAHEECHLWQELEDDLLPVAVLDVVEE